MSAQKRNQLEKLLAQVEETWAYLDMLFATLDESNGWGQKHGPNWTFAEVPYHLAYCNQDVVVRGLQLGPNYPEAEQELLTSPQALGAWNERIFADRPPGQTAAESVAQWRESCVAIRRVTASMHDADLARPCWQPISMGWATAGHLLMFCLTHDWSAFTQLRIHMGLLEPIPSAAITQTYLEAIPSYFPMMSSKEAAEGRPIEHETKRAASSPAENVKRMAGSASSEVATRNDRANKSRVG